MKIKYSLSKNKEVQTEETVEEKKVKELTVLSTFLTCVGFAVFILSQLFKTDSHPCLIFGLIGLFFMVIGIMSIPRDSFEKDRDRYPFRLIAKLCECFPNRIQKILFSEFPNWKLIFIPTFLCFFFFGEFENCLILNVLTQVLYWFLAVYSIVWGYRETRETTKDLQLA